METVNPGFAPRFPSPNDRVPAAHLSCFSTVYHMWAPPAQRRSSNERTAEKECDRVCVLYAGYLYRVAPPQDGNLPKPTEICARCPPRTDERSGQFQTFGPLGRFASTFLMLSHLELALSYDFKTAAANILPPLPHQTAAHGIILQSTRRVRQRHGSEAHNRC